MPSVDALELGVGDQVRFRTQPHDPFLRMGASLVDIPLAPNIKVWTRVRTVFPSVADIKKLEVSTDEEFTGKIVGLDDNSVYLHPWNEKLAAWTRVQNTQTGEIDLVKMREKPNDWGLVEPIPLAENERLIVAVDKASEIFSR